MPGSAYGRERVAAVCILPRIHWAVPLIEPVPWKLDVEVFRATSRSQCSWWCVGRFWADNVVSSPSF